ncbi:MAG TPA: tRNA (adenosine(37)-N6)-threonylcarbamoyltransferase complex dimerization subunit type 1 TsaB [Candidatus Methylomirabilis sp.]|nr:tRNA (adenosine(37)-N6)-threonylcarbamoyltransferase complex dimerization subunit type 1 TsaB [Candidatus Methylomirabilis sp.]
MILAIDTTDNIFIKILLKKDSGILAQEKIRAERAQGEKLLPAIESLLQKNKFKLKDIEEVEVDNSGGSFTSLRIGVATANALGFALGVPVRGLAGQAKKVAGIDIIEPVYDREPDIGLSHSA